uniref:28S ribosomal protein S18a, mitochondrial n=1 Tax=Parascaris equorum TaxID=6256 RepID=A0A914RAP1_PAREQ
MCEVICVFVCFAGKSVLQRNILVVSATEGNTTTVHLVDVPDTDERKVFKKSDDTCSLCTCNIPIKVAFFASAFIHVCLQIRPSYEGCSNVDKQVKYSDVLILEQFMREDGTVLPRQLTGLCKKQQLRVERCVMQTGFQAHWAGLFPDKTLPDFDRAGYKRFNRYWNDDMDMYRLKQKIEQGTWYYVKRYRAVGGRNAKY